MCVGVGYHVCWCRLPCALVKVTMCVGVGYHVTLVVLEKVSSCSLEQQHPRAAAVHSLATKSAHKFLVGRQVTCTPSCAPHVRGRVRRQRHCATLVRGRVRGQRHCARQRQSQRQYERQRHSATQRQSQRQCERQRQSTQLHSSGVAHWLDVPDRKHHQVRV